MLHTLSSGPASGIQAVGATRQSPARCGAGPRLLQQGAIAVTSQDAPVRWRLYSEFALRGVRVVLIENIV